MALVFDNRHNLEGEAGLHALIAGVSRYRHLPGGGAPPAKEDWRLPQLTATALTGYKIYRWLVDRRDRLPKKLATVRLLLSPSGAEAQKIAEGMGEIRQALADSGAKLQDNASPCTLDNFTAEAVGWRDDAAAGGEEGVTFFYFAGHGIQRKNNDPVLLPEDFANPTLPILRNTITFNSLFDGMVPPPAGEPRIARTQLYFVDACRVIPPELVKYQLPNIADVLDARLGGVDDRSAPIFYGTVSNTKAYAKSGQQTLFSEALLECLEGFAGTATNEVDEEGYARYCVTVNSLSEALNQKVAAVRALGVDQEFYPTQRGRDAIIVSLPKPPDVECILEVEPGTAARLIGIELADAHGASVPGWKLSPVVPHPHRGVLRAGLYALEATVISPPLPPYEDRSRTIFNVQPLAGSQLKAKLKAKVVS
jgi:hypothetical protein